VWDAHQGTRTLDYPFTVIQMEMGRDGKGQGTLSYATKVIAAGEDVILENFGTQPVMLTEIKSEKRSSTGLDGARGRRGSCHVL
jgi:hypothetical protein